MKQQFRIAITRKGLPATHYVIRDDCDLVNMLDVVRYLLEAYEDIELIKWVPIPALEGGVNHD